MKILRFTSLAFILLAGTIQAGAIGGFGPNGGGSGGSGIIPSAVCGDASHALAWNGTAYFCQAITGAAAAGGLNGQAQWNNTGALDGFTFSGDLTVNTGTGVAALSTVNANVGAWGDATHCATITLNAKGLATAASQPLCTPAWGSITGTPTTRAGYGITDALTNVLASGNIFIGSAGSVATAQALSGDCTLVAAGAITCTKTGGVAFAASATTDATNATNISSGTIGCARLPALTGDITSSSCATTLATVNANTGACGDSTHVCQVTLNAKGLATAASAVAISGGGGGTGINPVYIANNFYWGMLTIDRQANTGAQAIATTRFMPVWIGQAITISQFCVRVTTVQAGGNFLFGIYANNSSTNLATGSALGQTNNGSTASLATVCATMVSNVAISTPGLYWVAFQCDNAVALFDGVNGNSTWQMWLAGASTSADIWTSATVANVVWTQTGTTYGTLPTATPTEAASGSNLVPLFAYKVASVP